MSDKLKAIDRGHFFEAIYPGDTAYRAFTDTNGSLHIMEMPSRDAVAIADKAASTLIADLEDASDVHGYSDAEINAVQHWLMASAFNRAHPPRESVPALSANDWPVSVPRFDIHFVA
jgi:hypothetical protein